MAIKLLRNSFVPKIPAKEVQYDNARTILVILIIYVIGELILQGGKSEKWVDGMQHLSHWIFDVERI